MPTCFFLMRFSPAAVVLCVAWLSSQTVLHHSQATAAAPSDPVPESSGMSPLPADHTSVLDPTDGAAAPRRFGEITPLGIGTDTDISYLVALCFGYVSYVDSFHTDSFVLPRAFGYSSFLPLKPCTSSRCISFNGTAWASACRENSHLGATRGLDRQTFV